MDHGEPWKRIGGAIKNRDGVYVTSNAFEVNAERIIVCINALDGIDDPAAFVAEAKIKRKIVVNGYGYEALVQMTELYELLRKNVRNKKHSRSRRL